MRSGRFGCRDSFFGCNGGFCGWWRGGLMLTEMSDVGMQVGMFGDDLKSCLSKVRPMTYEDLVEKWWNYHRFRRTGFDRRKVIWTSVILKGMRRGGLERYVTFAIRHHVASGQLVEHS